MKTRNHNLQNALRVYSFLLRFYPSNYRQAFGGQMLQTFEDHYADVTKQPGRVGFEFWVALLADAAVSIGREQVSYWEEGSRKENRMSNKRDWLVGIAVGLVMMAMLWLFLRPGLLLVALLTAGAITIAWVWVARRRAPAMRLATLVLSQWRIGAGMVTTVSVSFLSLVTIQTINQPPAPCSRVQIASSQPPAILNTGEDYFARGDYEYDQDHCDRAINYYTRAIELNPRYAEAYNNRAYTYMVMRNYAAALPDLDMAIQIRPSYVNALMNRGDIYNYYYNIDRARAIADYDHVIAISSAAMHNTSVCGHRMVALNRGMDAGLWLSVVAGLRPFDSGCTSRSAAQ